VKYLICLVFNQQNIFK